MATDLPQGDVTFLFSDLEGSTRLLERDPAGTGRALARHHELLAGAVTDHGGLVFETVGDAVYAAFAGPLDAVLAAIAGQRALAAEDWGSIGALRARMAIHGGQVERQGAHYFGPPLFRCARLQALGHGGQTLVSQAVVDHLGGQLPADVTLRSLGSHRLKDLAEPERVHQLCATGLPTDFPPPRSLGSRPNNLPIHATSFIGRQREMAGIATALESSRLVSLLGPGGIGKTRLALQVAADNIDRYEDGVFFVPLASVTDPTDALRTVASVLAVHDVPGESPLDTLTYALRGGTTLLVLDNLEQIVGIGSEVAALLSAVPGLTILATSRVPLNVRGERHWPVAALEVPSPGGPADPDSIAAFETVQLFIQRARDVRPEFRLSDRDAAAVAAICRRLDGLPLAIELAAARMRVFEPADLLARLGQGSSLLSGGAADLPERQRTLRQTIAWSWDLLASHEQALAERLAVWVGGCTLDAVEWLCAGAMDVRDPLAGVSALVDASLLRRTTIADGAVRFTMLATIHEFASERLAARPDAAEVHRRHAEWVTGFVERAELRGPQMPVWLERTELEHDNVRAALGWVLGAGEAGLARRIVAGLWKFWWLRGHTVEGGRFSRATLDLSRTLSDEEAGPDLAGALNTAAVMIWEGGGDSSEALPLAQRAIAIYRRTGPQDALTMTMSNLAINLLEVGQQDEADALLTECLRLAREAHDDHETILCLANLAEVALDRGEEERSLRLAHEAVSIAVTADDLEVLAASRITLADALDRSGDADRACATIALVFADLANLNSPWHSVVASYVAARVLASHGRPVDNARLFGAVETSVRAGRSHVQHAIERELARTRTHLGGLLGSEAFEAAYADGVSIELAAAISEAGEILRALADAASPDLRPATD